MEKKPTVYRYFAEIIRSLQNEQSEEADLERIRHELSYANWLQRNGVKVIK